MHRALSKYFFGPTLAVDTHLLLPAASPNSISLPTDRWSRKQKTHHNERTQLLPPPLLLLPHPPLVYPSIDWWTSVTRILCHDNQKAPKELIQGPCLSISMLMFTRRAELSLGFRFSVVPVFAPFPFSQEDEDRKGRLPIRAGSSDFPKTKSAARISSLQCFFASFASRRENKRARGREGEGEGGLDVTLTDHRTHSHKTVLQRPSLLLSRSSQKKKLTD